MTDSTGDYLETEQKYDADPDFVLPELSGLPGLGGERAMEPKRYHLSATYFDTAHLDLIKNRITLRRRVGGSDQGWHLKLPVGRDTRQEVRAPLRDRDDGTVPAPLAAKVEDITAGQGLRPIAVLDTERTVVTLTSDAGQPMAEVADDLVTATRLQEEEDSKPLTWREIEVELLSPGESGALAVLEVVGTALREAGARRSASASKLSRLLQS